MPFFIIFVMIPLIEIGLFIEVGAEIGLLMTLLLCFLTAVLGGLIIRNQGLKALFAAQIAMNHGEIPVRHLFDGLCLALAGAFLVTPGFFTDIIGFSLLVPSVRNVIRKHIAPRFFTTTTTNATYTKHPLNAIDAEFEHVQSDEIEEDKDEES